MNHLCFVLRHVIEHQIAEKEMAEVIDRHGELVTVFAVPGRGDEKETQVLKE